MRYPMPSIDPEERRAIIEELKAEIRDDANMKLLTLENAQLKEKWDSFDEGTKDFREQMNSTTARNKRQITDLIDKLDNAVLGKVQLLCRSNDLLKATMSGEVEKHGAVMASLVEEHETKLGSVRKNLDTAAKDYVSKAKEDIREAHAENKRFWSSWKGRNAAVIIYLAVAPALTVLDMLARHFGWF